MKTQQELMQAYWGPGGIVDMVKEYNEKHGCDVKPWKCVKTPCVMYENHPGFVLKDDNEYTFALTILYDDKLKEHRPVFVGSELYYKERLITVDGRMKGEDYLRDGLLNSYETGLLSWNPPTPKRTFKLNDLELPCPVRKGEGEYVSSVCGIEYYFTDYNDRNKVASAIANILIAARDKE